MSPVDEASGIHPETLAVPPGVALTQLAIGHYVSRALCLAAKLGLADLLKDGPRDGRRGHPSRSARTRAWRPCGS